MHTFVRWFSIVITVLTAIGLIGTTGFELYVRWSLNQNFAALEPNGLLGLAILLGVQMIGLVWLSRSH